MRVSALIDAEVRDRDGRHLGHVTEVRATAADGAGPQVTELLLGRAGLRRRLLGRGRPRRAVPFAAVELLGPRRLVVDRSAVHEARESRDATASP